jgi:hypothetical protein
MQKRQQYKIIIVGGCVKGWVIKKLKQPSLNLFGAIIAWNRPFEKKPLVN